MGDNMNDIYLDYAATCPLSPQVKSYIIELLDTFQNPSSIYQSGINARQIINDARTSVAKFINANPDEIIFTSSGSASNTLAIRGICEKDTYTVFYSPLLHKSALKCIDDIVMFKECLKVTREGKIDIDFLKDNINILKFKPFVIIEYANSEIGTIQPVKDIIAMIHDFGGIVYVDCTGAIPSIPVDLKDLDADLIGFSAHKLGALKGCGVLYKKNNIEMKPLIYGTQENGYFGGTENLLGIASLGKSVEKYDYSSISSKNRDYVYDYIINNIPNSYLVGAPFEHRLPHNLYMCFKGVQGESLMILLDMNDIQVSTGSACTSGDLQPSSTLTAIGMDKEDIHSCIRLSFGEELKESDLLYICKTINKCVQQLRNFK